MSLRDYYLWYDRLYAAKDYEGEVATVLAQLTRQLGHKPARLLDIGCGTGSHALHFAGHDLAVTGVDIEQEAIEIARARAEGTDSLTFHAGRVEDLEEKGFDAAVSLFNVINYIPEAEALRSTLQGIAQRLKPGSPFLFDAWNGIAALLDPPKVKVATVKMGNHELTATTRPTLDPLNQTCTLETTFVGHDERGKPVRFTQSYRHRLWTPRELRERLEEAGFDVVRVARWMEPEVAATEADWKVMVCCGRRE